MRQPYMIPPSQAIAAYTAHKRQQALTAAQKLMDRAKDANRFNMPLLAARRQQQAVDILRAANIIKGTTDA